MEKDKVPPKSEHDALMELFRTGIDFAHAAHHTMTKQQQRKWYAARSSKHFNDALREARKTLTQSEREEK